MDLKQVAGRLSGRPMIPETHVAWVARAFGRRQLAPLRPDDVVALAATLEAVGVPAGTKVVSAGSAADAAYIVESGEVELFTRWAGNRSLVSIQRAGGVFGDVPLLCGMAFPFDAIAKRDTRLLLVREEHLVDLLATHPAIALRWLSSAVRRLEHANRRLASLTTGDVADRVTLLLADEVVEPHAQSGQPVTIELTQTEIAALLGASRQAVNQALQRLVADGLVRTEYGKVVVDDPAELVARGGRAFPAAPSC